MTQELKDIINNLKELTAKLETFGELLEAERQKRVKSDYMTLREACQYLGVTRASLYCMTSRKQIPHYKPNGKSLFFKESDLVAWIESKRVKTADEIESEAVEIITNFYKNKKQ